MSTAIKDRQAWLAERRKAIGASEVGTILGLSPYKTPWEVWAEKVGKLTDSPGSAATRAGQLLESAILDAAEDQLGPLDRDVRVKAIGIPLAATCDAITADSGRPVEAKTTGIVGPIWGAWGQEFSDDVPDLYLVQVHAQLLCTGAMIGYLFALIPGRGIVEYHIHANKGMQTLLADKIGEWWERHIVQGIEPAIDRVPSLDVVRRIRREEGKSVELGKDVQLLIDEWESRKAAARAESKLADELQAKILMSLGDAESALLPNGKELTYFESQRKGYTVEPSTYRTLRTRKAKSNGKDANAGDATREE